MASSCSSSKKNRKIKATRSPDIDCSSIYINNHLRACRDTSENNRISSPFSLSRAEFCFSVFRQLSPVACLVRSSMCVTIFRSHSALSAIVTRVKLPRGHERNDKDAIKSAVNWKRNRVGPRRASISPRDATTQRSQSQSRLN